jgi:serine protease Do
VSIKDLTAEIASSLKVEAVTGVVVADVKDDGPAHGKIEAYDVIVAVDGRPTETTGQLRNQIALTLPGSKATLTLFRAGKKRDVSLVLTEKDEDNAVASTSPKNQPIWAGLTVESLTQELRVRLKLNKNLRGVVVTGVEPGSAAERCGLEEGDIISGVNRDRVESKSDFDKAIDKKADHVTLRVFRRGGYDFIVLKN